MLDASVSCEIKFADIRYYAALSQSYYLRYQSSPPHFATPMYKSYQIVSEHLETTIFQSSLDNPMLTKTIGCLTSTENGDDFREEIH
jgi:hypothetical protein